LEDNLVSWRIILGVILDLFGAFYGAYKQRFMGGDRVLRAAFVIMFSLGCYKYLERAVANCNAARYLQLHTLFKREE
jgi:uncharacterized membrane protein YfcA